MERNQMSDADVAALLSRIRFCRIAPHITQYYLGDGWALHRHTAPDTSPPHDHPHTLESRVLGDDHLPEHARGVSGGYTEEVFEQRPSTGAWEARTEHHAVGEEFGFVAEHVHRVVALDRAESWTLVRFGKDEVPWRHYPEALA